MVKTVHPSPSNHAATVAAMLWRVTTTLAVTCSTVACHHSFGRSGPDLEETIAWMQKALASHNGQRLDPTDDGKHPVIAKLTANNCKLQYVVNDWETVHYDLSDVNPITITTKEIGQATWVVFDTRNFDESVRYTHPDPKDDYSAESGGFSLATPEYAESFAKALRHAVELCGGKPSTF